MADARKWTSSDRLQTHKIGHNKPRGNQPSTLDNFPWKFSYRR